MGLRSIRVSTQSIYELLDSLCLVMNCQQPFTIEHNDKDYIVPCGKCLVCLQKRRNDWVFRLSQEHKRSLGSAFITLTYSPRFYPEEGLQKRDFQLFMKRLRKQTPNKKLRYYAVGEYGSKRMRAHYHAILFNWDGDERSLSEAWSVTVNGKKVPLGIVHIGRVNQKSIRYTTKYVIQRAYLPRGPQGQKLNPPFALMSRQYGLGLWYLTDAMVAWHRSGYKTYVIGPDGEKQALPRYYKKFIFHEEEVREYISKRSKREAEAAHQANVDYLKSEGYDPDKIIAEMREAVLSRVKEKIAYSQTF